MTVEKLLELIDKNNSCTIMRYLDFSHIYQSRARCDDISIYFNPEFIMSTDSIKKALNNTSNFTSLYNSRTKFRLDSNIYVVEDSDDVGFEPDEEYFLYHLSTQSDYEKYINERKYTRMPDLYSLIQTFNGNYYFTDISVVDFITNYQPDCKALPMECGHNLYSFAGITDDFTYMIEACERLYVSMGTEGYNILIKTVCPIRDKLNKKYISLEDFNIIRDLFENISDDNDIKKFYIKLLHIYKGQRSLNY